MTRLKIIFEELILKLGNSPIDASEKWEKISNAYYSESRFYHNLTHLDSMLSDLEKVKNEIQDWDSILLSLFYHDIVYDATKSDNEEQSSEFAINELVSLNVPTIQIQKVEQLILATKSHIRNENNDINFFIDADISILGYEKDIYDNYSKNIRLEYLYYPGFVFNQGRINILDNIINYGSIFKTEYFKNKYEKTAQINLKNELDELRRMNNSFNRTHTKEFVQYLEFDGDLSEFFYNSVKILDQTEKVEKISYYPGWFDSGYYRFNYKGSLLHLEYEGMLGTFIRTEPNATENDKSNATEIFQKLLAVRLTEDDLERVRKFYINKNTANTR